MQSREVRFASDHVVLVGEIVMPAGPPPWPGVVLLHGASQGERHHYRPHAEAFAAGGIAALIFDRRGEGASSGPPNMDIPVLAADAMAAHRFLCAQPDIDPTRTGLWGYSNGAWVASLAAEQVQPAFLVLSGAAGVSPAEAEIYRRTEDLRRQGIAAPTVAAVERAWTILFGAMASGEWEDAWDDELRSLASIIHADLSIAALPVPDFVRANPLLSSVPPFDSPLLSNPRETVPGAALDMGYDPVPSLQALRCPVLVVMAENDGSVPVAQSMRRFEQMAAGRGGSEEFRVVVLPGAEHSFAASGEVGAAEQSFVPGYLDLMTRWVAERMLARPA